MLQKGTQILKEMSSYSVDILGQSMLLAKSGKDIRSEWKENTCTVERQLEARKELNCY